MRKPWIFLIALWCLSCVQFIDADSDLDVAVERFSEPIVRLASGTKPGPGDIRQMMSTLPILLVNIPGVGDVDLKKVCFMFVIVYNNFCNFQLNPRVLEHILRGGQIPGLPRDKLDQVVKQYTQKMYEAAVRARANTPIPGDEKYLPPLESLPPEVVTAYMNGRKIPFLDQSQMRMIQEYYTSQIPVEFIGSNSTDGSPSFNPQMFSMLKLLPPNYNLTKIPPEVITQILHGEMPDFAKLPQDILDYLRENSDKMFNSFKISVSYFKRC